MNTSSEFLMWQKFQAQNPNVPIFTSSSSVRLDLTPLVTGQSQSVFGCVEVPPPAMNTATTTTTTTTTKEDEKMEEEKEE